MPAFEPRSDPTSTSARWTRWLKRFNTYLLAADIKDDARKRAKLLYQAGPEVHEIFKTLEEGEDQDFDYENKQRKQQAKGVGISQNGSNTESSEEEDYVYTVSQETREKTHATIKINGQDILFLVDTGALTSLILRHTRN